MPQMKPLNWMYLFISFSIIMITMNMMNFYSFNNFSLKPSIKKLNMMNNKSNWKW